LKEVKINVPDEFLLFWESKEVFAGKILFLGVIDLLREGKISRGKAAELLGVSIHDILDLMGKYGIPVIDQSPEELDRELSIWENQWDGVK